MAYSFTIKSTHPSLKGHFPSNPIVPGVVILDEVINIIKELKPEFTVEINEKNETSLSFSCSHNETKLVTGQLMLKSIS